jgi:replicative DNA helicase
MSSMKCGINEIDKHLDGFNYGEMIISAARTGHGNFYLIASIVRGICYTAKDDPKCMIFTDRQERNIKQFQPGDENIFTFHKYDCTDLNEFKTELSKQISKLKPKILIIENSELKFNKNKEYYRYIKLLTVENNILTFIKADFNRKIEISLWRQPSISLIDGAPLLEKLADKFILMSRPDILGIKYIDGREQTGIVELYFCACDLCTNEIERIQFNKDTLSFVNLDPDKARYYRF